MDKEEKGVQDDDEVVPVPAETEKDEQEDEVAPVPVETAKQDAIVAEGSESSKPVTSEETDSKAATNDEDKSEEEQDVTEDDEEEDNIVPSGSAEDPTTTTTSSSHHDDSSATSPYPPLSHARRSHSHQKLRSYESRRRTAYGSKLSSSSLYWRSFRELVQRSLLETKQAERLVLSHVLADETFGRHMEAIRHDLLDDQGRTVTDPKKKKKILARRAKEKDRHHEYHGADAHTTNTTNTTQEKESSSPDTSSTTTTFKLGDEHGLDTELPMLGALVESHATIASRYEETTKALREQVTEELTSLREQLEDKIETMEALGDAILEDLEAAEYEVTQTWELYYAESSKAVESQEDKTAQRAGASLDKTELSPQRNCTDTWVYEMHYRMAVAYLSSCWEKCSAELSRLFTSLKATEVSRRHRLRQLLIVFLQKQEALWMGLPATIAPVLKGIVDRPMDPHVIEENVQNSIKIRAQAIQRHEQLERPKQPIGPGLSLALAKEGNFELSSPLLSDLLCHAKVVVKKDAGMMRSWKTVLAITTRDSFLHLFDVPPNLQLQTGSAVEVAFHALVPPVEIPTMQNIRTGFAPKAWNRFLAPLDSVVLANCQIVMTEENDGDGDDEKSAAFELHETVFKQGAKAVFGKVGVKKMYFRTRSYEDTQEWMEALRAQK